ncbi:pentapeptide repeat-containing protein [Flavobacteriales bacterium]|nr:pentapeptide repeat-containing protein [Flavobacteriales bacterium]
MKRKIVLLLCIALSILFGWTLGYLRLPYVHEKYSFWLGAICFSALFMAIVSLLKLWNKQALFSRPSNKKQDSETASDSKTTALKLIVLVMGIGLCALAMGHVLVKGQLKDQAVVNQHQKKIIKEQGQVISLFKNRNFGEMINAVLILAERELELDSNRRLSNQLINRMAALSQALEPYTSSAGDSLNAKAHSPERGQLLLALSIMQLDSITFMKIKSEVLFTFADLRGADLEGADLSGIDLSNSVLENANLMNANLSKAQLQNTNLYAANMRNAQLEEADFSHSNLSWAVLNDAYLKFAVFNGAYLRNTQLMKADLREVFFQYADLSGAILHESDLSGSDLIGTRFIKTNFTKVNLGNARLVQADFTQAILYETALNNAKVENNWFTKVSEWKVLGEKNLFNAYVIDSTQSETGTSFYVLRKK